MASLSMSAMRMSRTSGRAGGDAGERSGWADVVAGKRALSGAPAGESPASGEGAGATARLPKSLLRRFSIILTGLESKPDVGCQVILKVGGFPGIILPVRRCSAGSISETDGDAAVESLLGDLTLALVFHIQVQIQIAVKTRLIGIICRPTCSVR